MSDDVMTPMVVPEPPDGLTGYATGTFERDRLRIAWRMGWVSGHAIVVEKMERVLARGREQGRQIAAKWIEEEFDANAAATFLDDDEIITDFLESTGGPDA